MHDSKHSETSFLPNLMDSLCLRVAHDQVPIAKSRIVAIFVLTTTPQMITLPPLCMHTGKISNIMEKTFVGDSQTMKFMEVFSLGSFLVYSTLITVPIPNQGESTEACMCN
jgi:hypothetical protein